MAGGASKRPTCHFNYKRKFYLPVKSGLISCLFYG